MIPSSKVSLKKHAQLFIYSFATWFLFFLIGLPDYYQSWPLWAKIITVVFVTIIYFPLTHQTLLKFWDNGRHLNNSLWLAFYLTVPFFIYDYLLIGIYWDYGIGFVIPFWYLTLFYFSFWIQFPFIAKRISKTPNS